VKSIGFDGFIRKGKTGTYIGKLPVNFGEPIYAVKWNRFNKGHACIGYYHIPVLTGDDVNKGCFVCKDDIKKIEG
jgi:hypothetical protein